MTEAHEIILSFMESLSADRQDRDKNGALLILISSLQEELEEEERYTNLVKQLQEETFTEKWGG